MTLIFGVFFVVLAGLEKKGQKKYVFEGSIFHDFLDGQKSRSQGSRHTLIFGWAGSWAPWGTIGGRTKQPNGRLLII